MFHQENPLAPSPTPTPLWSYLNMNMPLTSAKLLLCYSYTAAAVFIPLASGSFFCLSTMCYFILIESNAILRHAFSCKLTRSLCNFSRLIWEQSQPSGVRMLPELHLLSVCQLLALCCLEIKQSWLDAEALSTCLLQVHPAP